MMDQFTLCLTVAYGSLQNPHYAFVDRALRQRPYRTLVADLEQALTVEEITDSNYDVSFGYVLGDQAPYLLQISVVGPFATLFPLGPHRTMGPALTRGDSAAANSILRLLSQHGVAVVDQAVLSLQTPLPDLQSGQPLSLYQALFTTG